MRPTSFDQITCEVGRPGEILHRFNLRNGWLIGLAESSSESHAEYGDEECNYAKS